jgi:hypothetical protein
LEDIMSTLLALLALALLFYSAWSLLKVPFARGRRVRQAGRAGASFSAFLVALLVFDNAVNGEAMKRGFLSAADERAAKAAGLTDSEDWNLQRPAAAVATEEAAAAQAERREVFAPSRQSVEAAARRAEAAEAARVAAAQAAAKEAVDRECREKLECWGERATAIGSFECPRFIERFARYDFEWQDGFLSPKFTHYRWASKSDGIVTVLGDKIKFQNGFGAWMWMTYECDVIPGSESVVDVRVREGRL